MTQIPKRWQIATPISAEADQELQKLTPIMRQILFNRGIATQDEARKFLRAL
ncbi:MAG: hypothetical protein GY803_05945, partial [Chloroflexi bacterium]|nr:hypothetical protein [Chloroflexota bacterium]MCP4424012.1 hypothetical protein [Chloroflexota bacterium]